MVLVFKYVHSFVVFFWLLCFHAEYLIVVPIHLMLVFFWHMLSISFFVSSSATSEILLHSVKERVSLAFLIFLKGVIK
jgi:hypothetical protein